MAASLCNRVAGAYVVLQRLANASPADRVAKALTTLGRVVRTIYILRYIYEGSLGGGSNSSSIAASRAMAWRAGCSWPTATSSALATTRKS